VATKRSKRSKKPAVKRKKSAAASKRIQKARSRAAKKGWATRRKKAREAGRKAAARSVASQKGWATRRARERLRQGLVEQEAHVRYGKDLVRRDEFEAHRREWYRRWVKLRTDWAEAKGELLEVLDDDVADYEAILDAIADDEAIDWAIAYGPEEVSVA
jgi:hypothetical protein